MSLTLREVQLEDLETFRRWRADPRYAEMLRRPGVPRTAEEAIEWYREANPACWLAVLWNGELRGYGMLTTRSEGIAEVSVLTDPDAPCDAVIFNIMRDKARMMGFLRLEAETYTDDRARVVEAAGFDPVQHWTLRITGPATDSTSPETGAAPPA